MSFILDALKRSEQERRKGGADALNPDHQVKAVTRRRASPNAPILVSAVVATLAVAGLGVWWFAMDRGGRVEVPPQSEMPEPVPTMSGTADTAPEPAVTESVGRAPPAALGEGQVAASPKTTATAGADPVTTTSTPGPSSPLRGASPEGAGLPRAATPVAAAAPGRDPSIRSGEVAGRLPRLRELAYEQRQAVMPLRLDVHVYDPDPQRRFIMINGKTLVGGTEIKPGLRIREILREGVVLDWQGEAFLLTSDE